MALKGWAFPTCSLPPQTGFLCTHGWEGNPEREAQSHHEINKSPHKVIVVCLFLLFK